MEWTLQPNLPACLSLSLSLCLYTVCQDPINSHSNRGERRRSAATRKKPGWANRDARNTASMLQAGHHTTTVVLKGRLFHLDDVSSKIVIAFAHIILYMVN